MVRAVVGKIVVVVVDDLKVESEIGGMMETLGSTGTVVAVMAFVVATTTVGAEGLVLAQSVVPFPVYEIAVAVAKVVATVGDVGVGIGVVVARATAVVVVASATDVAVVASAIAVAVVDVAD